MKSVTEFPKQKTSSAPVESTDPAKIFDIADWRQDSVIPFANTLVDTWPFCAA
jgi:hypothetical protein